MIYLRGACGLNSTDGESNESVYEIFGISYKWRNIVDEVVKHSTLRWFGHLRENGR